MKTLSALILLFAVAGPKQPAIDYRFDQVKRSVMLKTSTQASAAAAGQHAQSGDRVETGWFAYALIASEQYRAKFEIFSSTEVQLAEGTPGVLLSVERGKIRAMFDKITGSEPRVVKTPGALLAVRGTQFDVDVDTAGKTTVDVFEGTVEVRSELLREPLFVHAGQQSVYGRREPPTARPMPESHRRNDPNHPNGPQPNGAQPRGGDAPRPPQQQPPQQPPAGQPARPPSPPPAGHH